MSAAEEWDVATSSRSDAYEAWSRMLSATHLPWTVTELSPAGGWVPGLGAPPASG